MTWRCTIALFLVVGIYSFGQEQPRFHFDNGVIINKSKCAEISKLILFLPYPQSDQYQTISNLKIESGEIVVIPDSDEKCVRFELNSRDVPTSKKFELNYSFDVQTKPFQFDFNTVTDVLSYDTASIIYKRYTCNSGHYVVPMNQSIQHIGDSIWQTSTNIINYTRKCYEYVAATYTYSDPYTGLHDLETILDNKGGDCGNLSSIYISLLRYKKIPARHVVALIDQDEYHVWSEFYLEKYGWIPVDVTYKRSDPNGDYFGKFDGKAIVMSKDVALNLDMDSGNFFESSILQTFNYLYWRGSDCDKISVSHKVEKKEIR